MSRCPRCGAENEQGSAACGSCSAALSSPGAASGYRVGGPLVGGPAEAEVQQTRVGQPLGGQTPGSPSDALNGYESPARPARIRYVDHERPARRGWNYNFGAALYSLVVAAIVFGGGGYIVYQFYYLPKGPVEATRKFVQAIAAEDPKALSATLNSASKAWFLKAGQGSQSAVLNFFNSKQQGFEEGREYDLKFGKVNGKYAKVFVRPGPVPLDSFEEESLPAAFKEGVPITLIKEGNVWKVDLASTYKSRG